MHSPTHGPSGRGPEGGAVGLVHGDVVGGLGEQSAHTPIMPAGFASATMHP